MQKKIGIGIIGCGGRIRVVLKNILAEDTDGQMEIVAVCDTDPLSIESTRKEFPGHGFIEEKDCEALARNKDVDWVFVGSWNCFHKEHAVAALRGGKHLFCEKPLATSLEDCVEIEKAAAESNSIFAFGLVLRYVEMYQRVRELLEQGKVGSIISMEFNETLHFTHGGYIHGNWRRFRKNSGTHLLEKCCHDFDIVNWLTKSIPIKAASFGGNDFFTSKNTAHRDRVGKMPDGKSAFQTWDDPHMTDAFTDNKDIVDNQVVILQYANGIRSTFHTNCSTALLERRLYICGTEGTLRANDSVVEWRRIGIDEKLHVEDLRAAPSLGHYGGDKRLAEGMYQCMRGKGRPLAGVREGLLSAVACFGVDKAMDTGEVVDFSQLWSRVGINPQDYSAR